MLDETPFMAHERGFMPYRTPFIEHATPLMRHETPRMPYRRGLIAYQRGPTTHDMGQTRRQRGPLASRALVTGDENFAEVACRGVIVRHLFSPPQSAWICPKDGARRLLLSIPHRHAVHRRRVGLAEPETFGCDGPARSSALRIAR